MIIFYAKSTGGFYNDEWHGTNMPSDAVQITQAQHTALMAGIAEGKEISTDAAGKPILIERPEPTGEEKQRIDNAQARAYLAETDWYVVRQVETGRAIPEDIRILRQAARDKVQS